MPQFTQQETQNPQQFQNIAVADMFPSEMLTDFTTFRTLLKEAQARASGTAVKPPKTPPVPAHYEWKVLEHAGDGNTGWEGALLHVNVEGIDYYALYHEGANDMQDARAARAIYSGEIPSGQLMAAESAITRWNGIIAQRQQGKRSVIVDVGFSLGGVVCSLTSSGNRPCVVFDCPSPAAAYDKLGVSDCARNRNKITVLSPHASYYNSNGPHYGQILIAGEKFWDYPEGKRIGLRHFVKMSKKSHDINRIGHALAEQKEWKLRPACDVFSGKESRPVTVFQAVQEFVQDSKHFRTRQSFTEKLFSRLVDREAGKGPEAADRFMAKIMKWAEKSPRFERMITERMLGKKIATQSARSWVGREENQPPAPQGRGM